MLVFTLRDEVRRLMARYHRATQALIQQRASRALGRGPNSLLGIADPLGGVSVGGRQIVILRDGVAVPDERDCLNTPEARAVVQAIIDLAAEIEAGGEAVLADFDPPYFWFEMAGPLRAMLELVEEVPSGRPKVVFLDIDGVLLRPVDWLCPRNAEAQRLIQAKSHQERQRGFDLVQFDPAAVELVNRLARQAGAKIVLSSSWRSAIGAKAAVRKIIQQGIDHGLLHEDAYCPHAPSEKRKEVEVRDWLEMHRTTPLPPFPGSKFRITPKEERAHRAKFAAWQAQRADYGIDWVVLDDERGPDRLVLTSPDEGFNASAYRVALRALGGEDSAYRVRFLPDGLWEEVLAVHQGDTVAAARWVEGVPEPSNSQPVRLLDWEYDNALPTWRGLATKPDAEAKDAALKSFRQRLMADRPEGVGKVAAAEFRVAFRTPAEGAPAKPRALLPHSSLDPDVVQRMTLAAAEEAKEVEQARREVWRRKERHAQMLLTAETLRAGGDLMVEPDPSLWPLAKWVFSMGRPRSVIVDEVRSATEAEALTLLPAFLPVEALDRTDEDFGFEVRQALKAAAKVSGDLEAQLAAGAEAARRGRLWARQSDGLDERMLVLALMRAACRVIDRHKLVLAREMEVRG